MTWEKWFAWHPVYLDNNDYAKITGELRWVWLRYVYRTTIYHHTGNPLNPLLSYNKYKDTP